MMKGRRITAVLCLMAVITVFVGCTYEPTTAQRAETAGQEKSRIEKQEENGEAKELMTDLRAYLEKSCAESFRSGTRKTFTLFRFSFMQMRKMNMADIRMFRSFP